MATILEALQNAHYNLSQSMIPFQIEVGKDQLKNAVTLLEKGYDLDTDVDELLLEYDNIEDVPEA